MAVTGAFHVRRTLRLLSDAVTVEVKAEITNSAELVRSEAEFRAPKHTGELAQDITTKISNDGFQAKVGVQGAGAKKAFYAKWIEYGTRKMEARPFLHPALESQGPSILQRIDAAVSRALDTARNNPSGDEPL